MSLYTIIADLDYEAVDSSLYFDIGSDNGETLFLNVTITDNQAFEKEEDFSLHVLSEPNVIAHVTYTEVIIADDDGKKKVRRSSSSSSFPSILWFLSIALHVIYIYEIEACM